MLNVVLPNPVTGVAYTAEMNLINHSTIPALGDGFDQTLMFTMPGMMPQAPTIQAAGDPSATVSGPYNGPYANRTILGQPLAVFLGIILVLVGLKWFSERPKTLGDANPAFIRVGGYNVAVIFLLAGLASIVWRVIAAYTNIPGLKEFAQAA